MVRKAGSEDFLNTVCKYLEFYIFMVIWIVGIKSECSFARVDIRSTLVRMFDH